MSTRDDRHLAHYDRYVRQSVEKLVSTDVTVIEVEEPKSRIARLDYVPGDPGIAGAVRQLTARHRHRRAITVLFE
jgi:hypothetical protein